jgi:hypothetical protein
MSPLLAQSGHGHRAERCPLSGVKQTFTKGARIYSSQSAALRRAWPGTSSVADRIQWPFFGFRVTMQPQTTIAIIAATKIPMASDFEFAEGNLN